MSASPSPRHSSRTPGRDSRRRLRALASAVTAGLVASLALVGGTMLPSSAEPVPIEVSMTASASVVQSGDQLTYVIDGGNNQGEQLDDVVLTDQVTGMTGLVITSTAGTCGQSANLVTCELGSLAGFDTFRVTIRGTVSAPAGETLQNTVTVSATHAANTELASASTSVLVGTPDGPALPDLAVDVQGPSSIAPSTTTTLTMTVRNQGTRPATEILAMLRLPLDFSLNGTITSTNLFDCTETSQGVIGCTGGRVNDGGVATINVPVISGADEGTSDATAVVDPYDEIEESNEENNTGSLLVTTEPQPQAGPLTLTKTASPPWLRPGDTLTYTVTATNSGTVRIENVDITDGTRGLEAAGITATTTHGVCTVSTFTVRCNAKKPGVRLMPNESMTVTITGTVAKTDGAVSYMAGGLITNTATVTGNVKNKGVTATATTTTTVRPGYDLSLVQHAVLDPDNHAPNGWNDAGDDFRAWDHYRYEITVGNSGADDATGVRTRTLLPDGAVLKSFDAPLGVSCVPTGPGNSVTCDGIDIGGNFVGGGQVVDIVLTVIAPHTPGPVTATTTVDPTNQVYEADETNNVVATDTQIRTGIDLTVGQAVRFFDPADVTAVTPSGTLIYDITVSNLGTQDSTGVVLRDILPAGTRFRSAVGDHNFTCEHNGAATGGIVECHGGRIQGTHDHADAVDVATITVKLFAPTQPGAVKNQLRADPDFVIDEINEDNNINTLVTPIQIDDACCTYHEFTVQKTQTAPAYEDHDGDATTPMVPGKVAPSGVLDYDVTVVNHGSDVAFDVEVRDFVPAGAIFRYAEDSAPGAGAFSCTHSNGVIDCIGGTLDGTKNQSPGSTNTRTIHVSVFSPTQPGTYTNQSHVDPDHEIPEANETNNSDTEEITVALGGGGDYIDLTVDSTQTQPLDAGSPTDVVPNGELQYTLLVKNSGTAAAFNVVVRDTIPTGSVFRSAKDVTFAPGSGEGAFTCSESGGVVTCTGGTLDYTAGAGDTPLAPDDVRKIEINVFAPSAPGTYTNQAMVDPGNAIPENDETNNHDQTSTNVKINDTAPAYTDLRVASITPSTATPRPGETYTYEVVVENTGTALAQNVTLRNVLDPAATFVKVTAENDFSCIHLSGVVHCDGGVLDGSADQDPNFDADAKITIHVKAPLAHAYLYPMQSRVDPDNTTPESNEGNNARSVDVTATSQVNLTSSITTPGGQGTEQTMTFTAQATGSDGADNILAVAELPVGVIPLNVTPQSGWTCQIEENPINKVTCLGSLGAGATATFNVQTYVTIEGDPVGNVIVDPDNRVVETNDNDNASQG